MASVICAEQMWVWDAFYEQAYIIRNKKTLWVLSWGEGESPIQN